MPVDQNKVLESAIEGGTAYLASDGDVDQLVAPTLGVLSGLSLALPPPINVIVAGGLATAASGIAATKAHMMVGAKASARYLPLSLSAKVLKLLRDAPLEYWNAAAKDKLIQYAKKDAPFPVRAPILAAFEPSDFTYRFADLLSQFLLANGAKPWQAALVNAEVSYATAIGKDYTHLQQQIAIAKGDGPGGNLKDIWTRRVKAEQGLTISAQQAVANSPANLGQTGGAASILPYVVAGGAVLLLLRSRK